MAEQQFNFEQAQQVIEAGIAQAQEILQDPAKMTELLQQLQEKAKELPAGTLDTLKRLPLMASLIKGYVTREYTEISPKVIASVVSAVLYLVKGKDLIPDDVPILGIVDDIAVIALALKLSEKELDDFQAWLDTQAPEVAASVEVIAE